MHHVSRVHIMKSTALIFSIFVAFLMIGSVRFLDDNMNYDGESMLHMNINNRADQFTQNGVPETFKNVRGNVVILDSPIVGTTARNTLHGGDVTTRYAQLHGELPPGEHLARISVYAEDSNGNQVRRVVHRPIIVR